LNFDIVTSKIPLIVGLFCVYKLLLNRYVSKMVVYSNQEKLEMILIYGECQRNSKASQRLYRDRFPNKPVPSDKMFTKLAKNLGEIGCFEKKRTVFKPRTARDEDHTVAVLRPR
jgi:hypothetical protein